MEVWRMTLRGGGEGGVGPLILTAALGSGGKLHAPAVYAVNLPRELARSGTR
jgi:hypothetical protein